MFYLNKQNTYKLSMNKSVEHAFSVYVWTNNE